MLRYITSTLTACALARMVSLFAQEPAPARDWPGAAARRPADGRRSRGQSEGAASADRAGRIREGGC